MILLNIAISAGEVIIGFVFLYAGGRKLSDLDGAQIAVLDYRLVPTRMARLVAVLQGSAEIVTGSLLVVGIPVAFPLGILLLTVVTTAAGSALLRGLQINCHCFGDGEKLTPLTLLRNTAFVVVLAASWFAVHPKLISPFAPALVALPLPYILSVGVGAAAIAALFAVVQVLSRRSTIKEVVSE